MPIFLEQLLNKSSKQTTLSENSWTGESWFKWLQQEESAALKAFFAKPSLLIGTYNQERETTRDYEGREILELLQNANDQAVEANIGGRVLIELSSDGLIVANTGALFSSAGVASLQTNNFSPKRTRKKNMIGNKGLGFRSILNWSRLPIILSGNLRIAYSIRYAYEIQERLKTLSAELRELIESESRHNLEPILPLLAFPFYSKDGDLSLQLDNEKAITIYERCQQIVVSGYDTVIGMPFDQPNAFEHAIAQVQELRPEILLFTGNLTEICFHLPDQDIQTWMLINENGSAKVVSDGKTLGDWTLYQQNADLPPEVQENPDDNRQYQIIVAVPMHKEGGGQPLFSYFPTDIHIPLPVVCHATLELEQNRKHIRQGNTENEYILMRLAELLAQVAEDIAARDTGNPWAGCELLMPHGNYSIELTRVSFGTKLITSAKSRKIIPTLSGKHVNAPEARLIDGADATWLPAKLFPNVAFIRTYQDSKFLQLLDIHHLSPENILETFLQEPNIDLDTRVAFIVGLVENRIPEAAYSSALLLDTRGTPIKENSRVFIAPSSGSVPNLPDWISLNFFNGEMATKLQSKLAARDNRDLQKKISGFGLVEYSLASLISSLIAEANRAKKVKRAKPSQIDTDLLQAIFNLYVAERQGNKPGEYPEKSQLRIRNQAGELADVQTLYMGKGFSSQGEIVQALYESWAPEKLIKFEKVRYLTDDKELLKAFLLWVGVSELPREIIKKRTDNTYCHFILDNISYPARFGEYICKGQDQIPWDVAVEDYICIDGLDEILQHSPPEAIVAWLTYETRIFTWRMSKKQNGKLWARFGKDRQYRLFDGEIPSYIAGKFEITPWLLLPDGERICPKDCILGERQFESFFPRPAMPDKTKLKKFGISQSDFVEGLKRAGVLTSLAYLERDKIYSWLLNLPARSPDGKIARPLYQWLLDENESILGETGSNYDEFIKKGLMWGRHGEVEAYFPVSELHHADMEGFPNVLLANLKIVNLPKRVGAEKVKRLFGVEPLENAGINRKVMMHQTAENYLEYQWAFQEAKPFLFQLRATQTSQKVSIQTLKDLTLVMCTQLNAIITYQGEEYPDQAQSWAWIIEDKTLYVRAEESETGEISHVMLADAVGEALASLFRLSNGSEFARLFDCPPRERLPLLAKISGEVAVKDIETIKKEFGDFRVDKPVLSSPRKPEPDTLPTDELQGDTSTSKQPDPSTDKKTLNIDEVEVDKSVERSTAPIIIRKGASEPRGPITYLRVTDGNFCERKGIEFEEADTPPRFPLLVGHIVGRESPRCDILSFATEEARQAYRDGKDTTFASVVRFIEVKGRSDRGAIIELTGNELSAAEEYGERYYLYRFYEENDCRFILTVLSNPVVQEEALLPVFHVKLENAQATQQFVLTGGLQKKTTQVKY